MKSFLIIVFILLIAGAGAYYYLQLEEAKNQAPQPEMTKPLQLPQDAAPEIQHPITEAPVLFDSNADKSAEEMPAVAETEEPLPSLEESDNKIKEILSEIFGDNLVNQIFTPAGITHRFVVTIDTLPNKKLSNKFRLFSPTPGKFLIQKDSSGNITIDPDNFTRYSTFMQLLNRFDTEQFVKWYTRFYPLIQEAYDALGYNSSYKNRYFNDRFVFVIDHLLETPEVIGPVQLVQPKVFYEYADPALERLSAGQKILLRIGPANAEIVKAKLISIRKELATPPLDK